MNYIVDFFNSGFFIAVTTALTALAAWKVYDNQKKNYKIQAARVLITEIRMAEERIDQIRNKMNDSVPADLPPVFPTKSWKTYSHLFISDFDQDELKRLNSFYDYAELVEEFAKRDNSFFWVTAEERAKVTVQKIADFICESMNQKEMDRDQYIKMKRDELSQKMDSSNIIYTPSKSINAIKALLPNIPNITTTSCGTKLKNLAKIKN